MDLYIWYPSSKSNTEIPCSVAHGSWVQIFNKFRDMFSVDYSA